MKQDYLELTQMIERLHRRFLDVLRAELVRLGLNEVNAVQALLLANIGEEEVMIRELIERGYYQGSNVSYNIKKLTEMGFIEQKRSEHDRRSVRIRLTPRALEFVQRVKDMEDYHAANLIKAGICNEDMETTLKSIRRLERNWSDYIHYGPEEV